MRLEQLMYKPFQVQEQELECQRHYNHDDLIYLSPYPMYSLSSPLGRRSGPLGDSIFDRLDHFASLSSPLSSISGPLRLEGGPRGFKIFEDSKGGAPLMRLDYPSLHGLPEKHIQYGEKDYTGRNGDEAADLLAEILRLNTKIKFPGEENK